MYHKRMLSSDTLIIFTTSPTGLGHIRVTNALIKGLPKELPYHTIGINDSVIEGFYRLISTNWLLRETMEYFQTNQTAEKLQTQLFTWYEHNNTSCTTTELQNIIKANPQTKKVVIISTHAQLARRIQKIIEQKIIQIPIFHTVIVTDDSPQRLWAVCSSLVIVPSHKTLQELTKTFVCDRLHKGEIIVAPYPINPKLTEELSESSLTDRRKQLCATCEESTRICIPISGAAVQLKYLQTLITSLIEQNGSKIRFSFDIITKEAPYTTNFIHTIKQNPEVTIHKSQTNTKTVEIYDQLYESTHPPSIEITKPSEQCFKVLTSPKTKGGVLLLLTQPVGRQEYDNLNYLERNGFLPTKDFHTRLWKTMESDITMLDYKPLSAYRALMLPSDPKRTANLIKLCLQNKVFEAMYDYTGYEENYQLSPHGVERIWQLISERT